MKNPQKSKSHPFDGQLLDEKSLEIEIPSVQYLIIGWKILRNQNSIPSMANYSMKNPQKSKSHPSIARLLDEKSSEIEIPSLRWPIIGWKILRNRNPIPSIVDYSMKNPEKSKFHRSIPPKVDYWMKNPQKSKSHRSIAWLLDANIISLVGTVNYDMSRSETVMFTAVYVRIWSFHGTYSTGNTGSIRLYTARQHTAVIRRIRNGCSTARLRSYCNVHERSRDSERLDTVVYDRRNARPGKGWVLDFHLRPILNFIKDIGWKDGYWIFIYVQSLTLLQISDGRIDIGFFGLLILHFTKDIGWKDGYWIFIYVKSLTLLKISDGRIDIEFFWIAHPLL
jgi:hypothetical protein